jgi:hypothetical protein
MAADTTAGMTAGSEASAQAQADPLPRSCEPALEDVCALLEQAGARYHLQCWAGGARLTITDAPIDTATAVVIRLLAAGAADAFDNPGELVYNVHSRELVMHVVLVTARDTPDEHARDALVAARAALDLHQLAHAQDYAAITSRFGLNISTQVHAGRIENAYHLAAMRAVEARETALYGQAPDADNEARMLATLILDRIDDPGTGRTAWGVLHSHPELVTSALILDREPLRPVTVPRSTAAARDAGASRDNRTT